MRAPVITALLSMCFGISIAPAQDSIATRAYSVEEAYQIYGLLIRHGSMH
jgi:hypothetical protein